MPRELFGNVTRPSISLGDRKWYSVPVSLLSHAMIVAVIAALPLLPPAIMPLVAKGMPPVVMPVTPVVPPVPLARPVSMRPAVNPNAAPLEAPPAINQEPEPLAGFENHAAGIVDGGIVGAITDGFVEPPPPAPAAPPQPVRVGGVIRTPIKVRDVSPVYPAMAQAARVEGIVILEATIGIDGQVVNARVLRSVPLLDQAALAAVRQWQFTPTLLNGAPVPVVMSVTVSFVLR